MQIYYIAHPQKHEKLPKKSHIFQTFKIAWGNIFCLNLFIVSFNFDMNLFRLQNMKSNWIALFILLFFCMKSKWNDAVCDLP